MSITSKRFKMTALASALLAASGAIHAQEVESTEDAAAADDGLVEEVVVTGIRAAIQRSMDDKREAQNIVDTINAEDIGKTSDQNIADALSRVTGVSLQTRDGEGSTISVRGASPNQNTITMNGVELTSSDINQAVDLSSFSADILSKLEVIKTPSADHIEGSLGGSVNLNTRKPLDASDSVITGTLQGRYNDLSEENNYKIQVGTVQKLFDDKFGVSFFVASETNKYRKDELYIDGYKAFESLDGSVAIDQNGNEVHRFAVIAPGDINMRINENSSDRDTFNLGLQFRPTDTTDISFDATYSDQSLENKQNGVSVRSRIERPNYDTFNRNINRRGPVQYLDLQEDWWVINTDNRTIVKALGRQNDGGFVNSWGGTDNENTNMSLVLDQDISDTFRVSAALGYSNTKSESKPNGYMAFRAGAEVSDQVIHGQTFEAEDEFPLIDQFRYDVNYALHPNAVRPEQFEPLGVDCTSGKCLPVFGTSFIDMGTRRDGDAGDPVFWDDNVAYTRGNPLDIEPMRIDFLSENKNKIEDTKTSFALDFDWDVDAFGITTVEFGARTSSWEKDVDTQTVTYDGVAQGAPIVDDGIAAVPPGTSLSQLSPSLFVTDETVPDNFMETLDYPRYNATSGWKYANPIAAVNALVTGEEFFAGVDPSDSRSFEIDTNAAYLKSSFSFLDDRLTGDIGVRYVKTESKSKGFAGFNNVNNNFRGYYRNSLMGDFEMLSDTSLKECMPVQYNERPTFVWVENDELPDGGSFEEYALRTQPQVDMWAQRVDGNGYVTSSAGVSYDDLVDLNNYADSADPAAAREAALAERARQHLQPDAWTRLDDTYIQNYNQNNGTNYALTGERCYDPAVASAKEQRLAGISTPQVQPIGVSSNPAPTVQTLGNFGWQNMWRYGNADFTAWGNWDLINNLTLPSNPGGDPNVVWGPGIIPVDDAYLYNDSTIQAAHKAYEDAARLSAPISGSHSYSNLLPSLNVNYAITDDLIARFAVSKTMTRPLLDRTRAGLTGQDTIWNTTDHQITFFNPQLDPLTSKNLDVGFEWYFSDSSMFSAAFFRKNIKDYSTGDSAPGYIIDLRGRDSEEEFDSSPAAVILPESRIGERDENGNFICHQQVVEAAVLLDNTMGINFDDDQPEDICAQFTITNQINGPTAKIKGVELGYSQSFDFLPGYWLSGLGAQMNYTYQESEYADFQSTIGDSVAKSTLPVADTPKHSYNLTAFWEQDGHQLRLSYRGSSDSLYGTTQNTGINANVGTDGSAWSQGALWNEGVDSLDFSATYVVNDYISLTAQAINLTDTKYRTYYTSRDLLINVSGYDYEEGTYTYEAFDEGNALEDDVYKGRTVTEYKIGTTVRFGVRVNF